MRISIFGPSDSVAQGVAVFSWMKNKKNLHHLVQYILPEIHFSLDIFTYSHLWIKARYIQELLVLRSYHWKPRVFRSRRGGITKHCKIFPKFSHKLPDINISASKWSQTWFFSKKWFPKVNQVIWMTDSYWINSTKNLTCGKLTLKEEWKLICYTA